MTLNCSFKNKRSNKNKTEYNYIIIITTRYKLHMENNTIVNNNTCKLPLSYNYLDLRFHPYMFEYGDFTRRDEDPHVAFFRYILNDERYSIEDYTDTSIYTALRRQYEEFVGDWDEECEKAFDRVIIMFTTASR